MRQTCSTNFKISLDTFPARQNLRRLLVLPFDCCPSIIKIGYSDAWIDIGSNQSKNGEGIATYQLSKMYRYKCTNYLRIDTRELMTRPLASSCSDNCVIFSLIISQRNPQFVCLSEMHTANAWHTERLHEFHGSPVQKHLTFFLSRSRYFRQPYLVSFLFISVIPHLDEKLLSCWMHYSSIGRWKHPANVKVRWNFTKLCRLDFTHYTPATSLAKCN